MKRHDIRCTLGAYTFPFATEVSVESSWDKFTDTAELTVPRLLSLRGKAVAQGESLFKRGDGCLLRLGYDGTYDEVFHGYITGIRPGVPLRFSMEDDMYLLKRSPITKTYRSITLSGLLADISPISFQAADVELGPLRITSMTPAQVLDQLRETHGLVSWCRGGRLYAGLAYWPGQGTAHTFKFQRDIIDDDLEYQKDEDVRLRVEAYSIGKNNKKIKAEVGDPDGELRRMPFYNVQSKDELQKLAEAELSRLRFTGFRGSFTAFGQPHVRHGDTVKLEDPDAADRNGTYLVKSVTYSGGTSGYRQRIYLDTRTA